MRPLSRWGWVAVALAPVVVMAAMVVPASRNIAFWDEIDTAIDFIIRLDAGAGWREVVERLFAVNNEHRMVTSRLIFAASYWLTGTVNFHVIGAIGNLCLVGACAILVAAQSGWPRRLRMGVMLAFLMFQLGHFENFFWSGASIDHFQVVTLAVGALAALARGTPGGVALGAALALLATFTLAHGVAVWPVGALLLWQQRRQSHLLAWLGCAAAAAVLFLWGFVFNPANRISEPGLAAAWGIIRYWLSLLGAPLTLGHAAWAPLPGAVLVAGLAWLAARGAIRRQPLAFFAAIYAIAALALVAYGRSAVAGTEINSRYMVLGALAWAMLLVLVLERHSHPRRPLRLLAAATPALAGLAVAAHLHFAPQVETFVAVRDRAASRFAHYGEDGRDFVRLHPRERHADALLRTAAERGLYSLPHVSRRVEFTGTQPNPKVVRHLDELLVNDRAITVGGWAMRRGEVSKRGQVHVVLRSAATTLYFTTVTLPRPDVATAYKEPGWRLAGFRAVIRRDRLPAEDFEVGVLILDGARAELAMTNERLLLASGPTRPERAALE
ncbi:MAG: hypothetical protein JNL39_18555 [Opitutaceae bacterium]|nr:hypothetical protein [Opitutaceae bacterium]